MPRKGRTLEILVKHLEEMLGPQGVIVTSPEEFYDDGRKIGEIDVTLRGKFGSSTIFVGIECRDRPSEPPQGRDWMREFYGKKIDLQVHKMIAVSTKGFTREAIEFALKEDIDLIHVENIEDVDIGNWFKTLDFCYLDEVKWEIVGKVNIKTIPKTLKGDTKINETIFRREGNKVSLLEIVQEKVNTLVHNLNCQIVQG